MYSKANDPQVLRDTIAKSHANAKITILPNFSL